jgi:hypothetical protein
MRNIDPADLQVINEWMWGHGHSSLVREALPTIGKIEPGVIAGWLYITNSKAAWIEPIVSNPDAPARKISDALDELVASLTAEAKENGTEILVAFPCVPSLARRAKSLGFHEHQRGCIVLSRRI